MNRPHAYRSAAVVSVDNELASVDDVLAGVRDILVEDVAEQPVVRTMVHETLRRDGVMESKVVKAKAKALGRTKFEDYYAFAEPVRRLASHRYLALVRGALVRGEAEGVLRVKIAVDDGPVVARMARAVGHDARSPYGRFYAAAIEESYARRVHPSLEKEVRAEVLERAEHDAIAVFAENLQHLLLAAPFGSKPVVVIDPGIRTGAKCVALDASGELLEHTTIYALRSDRERPAAERALVELVRRHEPAAIAIGNGTGGREMEQLARRALTEAGLDIAVVSVNEAGASVYSASDVAREELPEVDVTVRGAVSIGRRLQDPLAELVKIDAKAIGVGQYQHDVDQSALERALDGVVETVVNRVGVELSTASPALLAYAAGIGPKLARAIVEHRAGHGLRSRRSLLEVKGLGPKAFEQAAGFLRLANGSHPLDQTAVHPERYPLVERMARDLGLTVDALVGHHDAVARIDVAKYQSAEVGEPTLRDILAELERPGRDPRDAFEPPRFRDDVQTLEQLRAEMVLDGIVTNVTAFGAFVDVGVHQDGFVHISQLADRFVRDATVVVKVGDRVRVRVLEVDPTRRRISLSRRGLG